MSLAELRRDGDIARLVLNRPERGNALGAELVAALDGALQQCADERAALLVIEGAGRHLCTGFDLSDLAAQSDDTLLARFVRVELMLQRLARAPFPTLAVARGRTMGAGADLFVACTWRVMAEDATLAFPGARGFGLVLGSRRLAACVGDAVAEDWILGGTVIDAPLARQHRLATHVVPAADEAALDAIIRKAADPDRQDIARDIGLAIRGGPAAEDACDLAALVRSAARPGLHERVTRYTRGRLAARRPGGSAAGDAVAEE